MTLPPIHTVAVIGAGISGVSSAAHLLRHGLEVTLFERSDAAGGVWHFDEETAVEPRYPNETPSKGDFQKLAEGADERQGPEKEVRHDSPRSEHSFWSEPPEQEADTECSRIEHAPPGPCYAGLTNNVPLTLMKSSLADWPPQLNEFVSQQHLDDYIRNVASTTGVNEVSHFRTRVEDAAKIGEKWQIRTSTWRDNGKPFFRMWTFDALVVATGHYHMPRIPNFPGLAQLKERCPTRVSHSKSYRRAAPFRDQTVLLVGASTSSTDIAKELAGVAKHTYQSSRGGKYDHPASALPDHATRIGNIQSFRLLDEIDGAPEHLPVEVVLQSGQKLCGIDRIVLCTGYVTSYSYLPQFHDDDLSDAEAHPGVLVTGSGNMVHNLHEDIFYIEDPSLAFVGKPYHTANFSLFDIQAQVVARAFANELDLPSRQQMRQQYAEKAELKGVGRDFHSLRATGAEPAYVDDLVRWVNEGAERRGIEGMVGHSQAWLSRYRQFREMIEKRIGLKLAESQAQPELADRVLAAGANVC